LTFYIDVLTGNHQIETTHRALRSKETKQNQAIAQHIKIQPP